MPRRVGRRRDKKAPSIFPSFIVFTLAVTVIVVVSGYLILSSTKEAPPVSERLHPSPTLTHTTVDEFAFNDYIRESVGIVSQGHPKAEELYRFLIERAIDAVSYSPEGYLSRISPLPEGKFYLLVNKYQKNRETYAYYDSVEKYRAVEIFQFESSREWLGIMILHELFHAWEDIVLDKKGSLTTYEERKLAFNIDKELVVHSFELELIDKVSRGRFLPTARDFIEGRALSFPVSYELFVPLFYDTLNSLFEIEKSEIEKIKREFLFEFAFMKVLLQRTVISEEERVELMRDWYRDIFDRRVAMETNP